MVAMPEPKALDLGPDFEQDPVTGKWRRKAVAVTQRQAPGEQGGPKGPEPTRYGDWEKKGITSDF
jgi:hypothetical protein